MAAMFWQVTKGDVEGKLVPLVGVWSSTAPRLDKGAGPEGHLSVER